MKITINTKDKTITFLEAFSMKDLEGLKSFITDINNWTIIPHVINNSAVNDIKMNADISTGVAKPLKMIDVNQISRKELKEFNTLKEPNFNNLRTQSQEM